MTIKMRDIAKDLGVSVITVSKVLRNHPEVGPATRERVLARVKELDYRPNLAARSLVTGRTYLVGLIVPDLLHPFFAEVAKSLSDVLRKSGYYLIISSSEEDPDLEQQAVDHLLARQLDTLVIASCRPTAELFVRIERHKTPYILIDRSVPGASANYVGVDDVAVGRLATEHLIAIGCKRIAHIRGPETSPGVARLEGYKRALLRRGITINRPLHHVCAKGRRRFETPRCGSDGSTPPPQAKTGRRLLLQRSTGDGRDGLCHRTRSADSGGRGDHRMRQSAL